MSDRSLIAIDLGTTNVKGIRVNRNGTVINETSRTHPSSRPFSGAVEQDTREWWTACLEVINQLSEGAQQSIEAIGITGQMHGCVCLDREGNVLRAPIIWQDARTSEQLSNYPDDTYQITGTPPSTGMMGPSLLWIRDHEPDVFERIESVMCPKDYIRFRLTGGNTVTDYSDAAGTLLYDVGTANWSDDILSIVGLSDRQLPEIRPSYDTGGMLARGVAKQTSLPEGIPVSVGAGDTVSASLGNGVVNPGHSGFTIGTSGQIKLLTDEPLFDEHQRIQIIPGVTEDRWLYMGAILSGGASLEWAKNTLQLGFEYEELLRRVSRRTRPGARGVLFLPYLRGERAPHMDPDARGAFVGLRAEHEWTDLIRAVLEGVSFAFADCGNVIEDLGWTIDRLVASGSGGLNAFWQKIVACVMDADVYEATNRSSAVYGASLLASVSCGWHDDIDEAVRDWVTTKKVCSPDPDWVDVYRELYPVYSQLYDQLLNTNSKLSDLQSEGRFEE